MTEELIKVTTKDDKQLVSARDLYKGLKITRKFSLWKKDNFKDFIEGEDFEGVLISTPYNPKHPEGKQQEIKDYALTIEMAKELSMMSHSEQGKKYRKYFIELEKKWNSPEAVIERGYNFLKNENFELRLKVDKTEEKLGIAEQQVKEAQPKVTYYDRVLKSPNVVTTSVIAKDYGLSAKALNKELHELGVQYKQAETWLLYQKYADKGYTKTHTPTDNKGYTHVNTKWTQAGRLFIYDTLKKVDILPNVEKEQ